jgi:hypothetical protein
MDCCHTEFDHRHARSSRRLRRLIFRAATIAIMLTAVTLIFIGEEWLLLDAPRAGLEFGVAVRAADVGGD